MSDAHPVMQLLGIDGQETPEPVAPQAPDAATPEPTAPAAPAEESETLDEALAALGDPGAPPTTPPGTEPPAAPEPQPPLALTPEQIAAVIAENEQFRAREAESRAEAEAQQFDAEWDEHIARGEDWYAGLEDLVRRWCDAQGKNVNETEGIVKHVILEGHQIAEIPGAAAAGFIVPANAPGYLAWKDTALNTRVQQTRAYTAQKAQPPAVERIAQEYGLDETDRTALRKYANYPEDAIKAIAGDLAAKNARLAQTHTAVAQTAAQQLADRFGAQQQLAPGSGPASPSKKPYVFTHDPAIERQETELVARKLRLMG